jgi:hypothetical protein
VTGYLCDLFGLRDKPSCPFAPRPLREDAFVFVPAALAGARGCDGLVDPRFRDSFAAYAGEHGQVRADQPPGEPGPPIR